MKFDKINSAKTVALVGIMAATLECGKLVFSFLPNIEVVTLLTAVYGYVFGWLGVAAALVFVLIEPLIWGFGSWFITYILYWPFVAFVFMIFRKKNISGRLMPTGTAAGLTILFGVVSSVIDSAFYLGINENYIKNLIIYYIRGVSFYIVQIICNIALFLTLYSYLSNKIASIFGKNQSERTETSM